MGRWGHGERAALLVGGDLATVAAATVAAVWVTGVLGAEHPTDAVSPLVLVELVVWLTGARLVHLYELTLVAQMPRALVRVELVAALTCVAWLSMVVGTPESGSAKLTWISVLLMAGLLLGWRYAMSRWLRQPGRQMRALVVERAVSTPRTRAALRNRGKYDLTLVWPDECRAAYGSRRKVAWAAQDLLNWVDREGIQDIFLDPRCRVVGLDALLPELRRRHVGIADIAELYSSLSGREPSELSPDKALGTRRISVDGYGVLREGADCVLACLALALLGPVLIAACLAIALESRGNPVYVQTRVGRYGREFPMFKVRTMGRSAEADGRPHWARSPDPRITRVGLFLRRSHIDEIPQLLNVLRGEMSLIGPRPERPEFVRWLSDRLPMYSARHHIRPGITGWAQVQLGYAASVKESAVKLEYDLFYVRRRSPLLDLAIVFKTLVSVARLSGR
ncbi:MAG: hypothetical protein NVSMB2_20720 [Chloroflexota bacterium]